jgi:D-alanyl-lipoteichoic acid acyltransferase DltB (MBOAT superfamily)
VLFNSHLFIFLFLPLCVLLFYCLRPAGLRVQIAVILIGSFLFYASWDWRFLSLLLCSIALNYIVSGFLVRAVARDDTRTADIIVAVGVTLNLAAIGVFKYANFIGQNFADLVNAHYTVRDIILPLGISFFTFEQIGYLVDIRRGNFYPRNLERYATFVAFFPRLVAGPILRYNEILPQLTERRGKRLIGADIGVGLTIFIFGLVKKSVLADNIAPYEAIAFAPHAGLDFFAAWTGALAYTCRLYFDFSGYSDMAIGCARCFGIIFPMNFNSPYKSASIIEFWRRWHITLSRFLRDYLYISLGGNRKGPTRRYVNLMITMLLGGLWHGANWTFVIWGGLHGLYLCVNHAWIGAAKRIAPLEKFRASRAGCAFGFVVTFICVTIGWVYFRAADAYSATHILTGMIGANGFALPYALMGAIGPLGAFLHSLGVTESAAGGVQFLSAWAWIICLLGIAWLLPNTQEILADHQPVLETDEFWNVRGALAHRLRWQPTPRWAMAVGVLGFIAVASLTRVSEFLYWQF